MTTQFHSIDPAQIDPETLNRFMAEGRRQRLLAFHNFVRAIFNREAVPAAPDVPANAVCCNH